MVKLYKRILKSKLILQLAIVFIFLSVTGLGCATATRTLDAPLESNTLRVMVWNVLHGANDVTNGAEKALKIIRDTKPDIVMLQESYDINDERPKLGEWLAGELGWNQHQAQSTHLCVLTPLDIETTFFHHAWHGVGARLRDSTGREFLAWSTWIDYRAYITYALRENPAISDEDLLALESVGSNRLKQANAIIEHLRNTGQLDADIPLLVGGDWNCPSHLDWIVDTTRVYKRRRALPLPVSTAMESAGFTDTFRKLYPNPVQHPGITWSPMFRTKGEGAEKEDQCFDRIDRLYLKNPLSLGSHWELRPVTGHVLPIVWEDENVPTVDLEFPSDHGALVIDLEWSKINN
jgi:endonuclease/exonuclease/phosphatase family metal-dependent hydrolase